MRTRYHAPITPHKERTVMLDELKTFIMRGNVVNLAVGDFSRLFPKPVAAPIAKACGFCATTIPLKARRCPPCTSELAAA